MIYPSLDAFLTAGRAALVKGPIALIFLEDDVEITSTLRHALTRGFRSVISFAAPRLALPEEFAESVHHVNLDMAQEHIVPRTVNRIIAAAPGIWIHYGFNAEYLYYPFAESRSIGGAIQFVTEERRDSILTFIIDAYAADLEAAPGAVSLDDAMIDRSGYYAQTRRDRDGNVLERQLEFHGGLRWRFEEHVPRARRHIDRVALFKSKPGLELQPDHRFNDQEYNTYQCPWHHSLTAASISFRTAKALKRNPGSRFDIDSFVWPHSEPVKWTSQQLMDLGLMEPGQWF